jgi:hypothetical protein
MHTWMIGGQLHVKRLESTGFSESETQEIRETLGVTDITADERAVVEAERIFEETRLSGVHDGVSYHPPHGSASIERFDYCVWQGGVSAHHGRKTRAEAARAAAEYVAGLHLPVERMDISQQFTELLKRGYKSKVMGYSFAYGKDSEPTNIVQMHDETPEEFHRRALREARSLDGEG